MSDKAQSLYNLHLGSVFFYYNKWKDLAAPLPVIYLGLTPPSTGDATHRQFFSAARYIFYDRGVILMRISKWQAWVRVKAP